MKFLRYLPLLLIFGVISLVSCSDNDDPVQEPTTTLYKANLYLKSWHDSTKVATELPLIEDTFLKYLGANTLKSFSISEGSEGVNDATVLRQCQLAAAVLENEEFEGGKYAFRVIKKESNDTIFVFEPTPSNGLWNPVDIRETHEVWYDDQEQPRRPVNYYISDVAVSVSSSASAAEVELSNRGYSVITTDLNDGVGGNYVFLGVKGTTEVDNAISSFYILVGTCIVGDFTKDGVTYSMVPSYGDDYGSLNSGTGGKDMWLYFTKEGKAVVENIKVVNSYNRMEGDDLIKGLKSDMSNWDNYRGVDINTGAGGKYRYLRVCLADKTK